MYFSAHVLFDSGQEPLGFLFRLLFFFSEILLNFQGCITVHLSRCFPSVSPMVFCPAAVSYRTQLLYITTAVSIRQDIFLLFLFFLFRPPEQALFPSQAVGFYCITLFQNLSTPFLIFFSSLFPVFSQLFFMSSKPLLSAYLQLRPKLPVPRVFSSLFILSGNAAFQKTFRSISAAFAVSLFFLYENARRFAPVGIRSF